MFQDGFWEAGALITLFRAHPGPLPAYFLISRICGALSVPIKKVTRLYLVRLTPHAHTTRNLGTWALISAAGP